MPKKPEDAFQSVIEIVNHETLHWIVGKIFGSPEDKYKVGSTANLIGKNDKTYLVSEVTENLENEKITYRLNADHWVSQIVQTFVLEPIEKGTRLTCVINL